MQVCMYVCMYVCIYIYIYIYMFSSGYHQNGLEWPPPPEAPCRPSPTLATAAIVRDFLL